MSYLNRGSSRILSLLLPAVLLFACSSSPNTDSTINPDTGKHAAGWASPNAHGTVAKAAPGAASGFSACQDCHGANFSGGTSNQTCLNTAGCHGAGINAPHSPAPWRSAARTHTTTNEGNAAVCALCHLNGRTPPSYSPVPAGVQPGCFNSTLCHSTAVGHPAGWANPDQHGSAAKNMPNPSAMRGFSACQPCHGTVFSGGVGVTCLNTAGCHGAGVNAPHSPAPWRTPLSTRTHTTTHTANAPVCALCHQSAAGTPGCFNNTLCHAMPAAPHAVPFTNPVLHGPEAKANLAYCEGCHANPSDGMAGSNPRFNVAIGSLVNGCEDCHAANTAHPVPWKGSAPNVLATAHVTAGNKAIACSLCHGANLAGGVGPACSTCHTAGSPLTLTNCTSCHGNPPTGSTPPNRAGAHPAHNALPGITNVCNACHSGAGSNTLNHDYSGGSVNVAFTGTTYNGNAGALNYAAAGFSCTNVSCHGGPRTQTATQANQVPPQSTLTQTPSWLTGVINVNTQCTACHVLGPSAGLPENNSYYSGRHYFHVYSENIACTQCHDTALLATSHFTSLNTPAMSSAAATIRTSIQYTAGRCNNPCHDPENW